MPAGPRIRQNNAFGTITDNPLSAGAGTFNSSELALMPIVSSAHAVITFDPMRQFGEPEIAVITVHTATATVATITRGQYGTVARSHPQGTVWVHAPIDEDVEEILTSSTRPTNPYIGQTIFETDTERYVSRDVANAAWVNPNMWADPPACRVFHNANQSIPNNAGTNLLFNSERFDTNSMHDNVTSNSRITINIAGVYLVIFSFQLTTGSDYQRVRALIRLNASIDIGGMENTTPSISTSSLVTATATYKFIVGDFVEAVAFQTNGASATRNVLSTAQISPEFSAVWVGRG